MADRVHPRDSPPSSSPGSQQPGPKPSLPQSQPPQGTYVIQVPKDQIYRYPPPANARRRFDSPNRPRRGCCCRCLCFSLCLLALLAVLLAAAAGVFYLVVRPKLPDYSVDAVSVSGFNLSSTAAAAAAGGAATVSPAINVTVHANNPNDKIKIHYRDGSSVRVFYNGVGLCDGRLPTFRQPSNNVTVFQTALRGPSILLKGSDRTALVRQQRAGKVPLTVKVKAPVKIQVGAVKTWEITVKVTCDLTVSSLSAKARIVSKDCGGVRVNLW